MSWIVWYVVLSYVLFPLGAIYLWSFKLPPERRNHDGLSEIAFAWFFAPISVLIGFVIGICWLICEYTDIVRFLNDVAKVLNWRNLSEQEILDKADEIRARDNVQTFDLRKSSEDYNDDYAG